MPRATPTSRANLRFARDQVANFTAALPGGRWTRWVGRYSLDEWAIAASLSVALFFVILITRQLRPRLKKSGLTAPMLAGALAAALVLLLLVALDQRLRQKSAVVIVSESVARRTPLEEAQTAFTLHDGSELLVLNQTGSWIEIADAADHTGWLPQKDLAFIP